MGIKQFIAENGITRCPPGIAIGLTLSPQARDWWRLERKRYAFRVWGLEMPS